MCGIIASFNTKEKIEKVNDFIIDQYQNQYLRGQKGFGIIRINKKGKIEIDRSCEPTKFLLDLYLKESSMIIAHHRTPTSTENKLDQTHPMFISNKILSHDYLIVHNGIINNDDKLRDKHIELGFTYQTECYETWGYSQTKNLKWNDSEAIAIELALFIEEKIPAMEIDNTAAFIVLQINKNTHKAKQVLFGKHGLSACLNIKKSNNIIQLSSEGEGESVKEDILFAFNIKDKAMKLKETQIIFVEKEPIKIEQKSFLPTNTEKQEEKTNTDTKTSIRLQRSWVDTSIPTEPDYTLLPPYVDKTYIEESKETFKKETEKSEYYEIGIDTERELDNQAEIITELISEYKKSLMTERLNKGDIVFYTSQIFRIVKTMEEIAEIGEKIYQEKEAEDEVNSYNEGFGISREDKRVAEIEASLEKESNFGY